MRKRLEYLVALLPIACSQTWFDDGEQAVHGVGVTEDWDTPESSVVVMVQTSNGQCSGTLITSQIVLTAKHCFTGSARDHSCRTPNTSATVTLGQAHDGPVFSSAGIVRRTSDCANGPADDIALVYLQTPVTPATMKQLGKPAIPAPRIFTPTLESPGGAMFGVAGYEAGNPRYVKLFYSEGLALGWGGNDWFWEIEETDDDWGTGKGDSGGPLFTLNPDGTRHVVGVDSGSYRTPFGEYMRFADITRPGNSDWFLANVTESTVPLPQHSQRWLHAHDRDADSWWGQLDYTGPCRADVDRDCDGWFDRGPIVHDNCIVIANSDQTDSNDNGFGDVCDRCPWDVDNDPDGDGVCTNGKPGQTWQRPDNCPLIGNPDQANCNAAAELAERTRTPGVEILGDACDPVPCAAPTVLATSFEPATAGHPQFGGFASGRVIQNTFAVNRVSPHRKTGTVRTPVSIEAQTGARFCQQNLELGYNCRAPENLRDDHFEAVASADDEVLTPSLPWHRVSMDWTPRDQTWGWSYDNSTVYQQWMYWADWSFWMSGPERIPPASDAYGYLCRTIGDGTCLDGVLWYHAISNIGETVSFTHGIEIGLHGHNLANSYLDIKPDRAYAKWFAGTGLMREYILRLPVGDPAPYEDVMRTRVRPIVSEDRGGPAHVVEDHGGAWDASEWLSPGLQARLLDPATRWLSAAEPRNLATNLDASIQAVALDPDGNVLDAVIVDGSGAWLATEIADAFASDAITVPRTGWVGTFSRDLGGVVIAGGTNELGESMHDVMMWRYGIGWTEIALDQPLDAPVAMVFSPADRKLWILDYKAAEHAELLRVDPTTGATELLGRFDRNSTAWERHFLAVDRHGGVLLVASSETEQRTAAAVLGVDWMGQVYAIYRDVDLPFTTSEPIVDQDEYGFVARDDAGAITQVVRRTRLGYEPGYYSIAPLFQRGRSPSW